MLALALAAFAPAQAADYADAHVRVLSAPDCVDAANMITEYAPAPLNATYLRVQHMGDPGSAELAGEVANPVTWPVGRLTGLVIPPGEYAHTQRGWRDVGPPNPASAFQLQCRAAGFVINSRQFGHSEPVVLAGPSISIARDLQPLAAVFGNATSALTIAASVALPWVDAPLAPVTDGTAQGSFFYYARDVTTNVVFAHLIALFDNRAGGVGGTGDELVSADAFTAFADSPLRPQLAGGGPTQFVTLSQLSAAAQFGSGWSEARYFRAHVTYAQFRALLARLRATSLPDISPRPEDYRVSSFGFLGEIFPGVTRAYEVGFAGSVSDLQLSEAYYDIPRVQAIEYYNRALDHYFLATRIDDIAALDFGVHAGWSRTGESFLASPAYADGMSPVCRFYLPPPSGDSHFFSASRDECAEVERRFPSFYLEDTEVMFIGLPDTATGGSPPRTTPVYRLWNGRAATNHRYTTQRAIRDVMIGAGWILEGYGASGVAMCAPIP